MRGRRRTGKLGIDKGPKLFGLGLFSPSQQAPPPIQCSPWDPGHSNPIHPPSFLQTFVASVATHVVMEYFAQRNCPLSYILSTTKCDIVFFIHHCLLDLPQGQQDRPSSLGSLTMAVFSDPINWFHTFLCWLYFPWGRGLNHNYGKFHGCIFAGDRTQLVENLIWRFSQLKSDNLIVTGLTTRSLTGWDGHQVFTRVRRSNVCAAHHLSTYYCHSNKTLLLRLLLVHLLLLVHYHHLSTDRFYKVIPHCWDTGLGWEGSSNPQTMQQVTHITNNQREALM